MAGLPAVSGIERLPRLYGRLKRKEPVKIVLYGDSISCGCDCSGLYGLEPGQPQWSELLIDQPAGLLWRERGIYQYLRGRDGFGMGIG